MYKRQLLDLAKSQKVDLVEISITKLADQFLEFIKNNRNLNLETASEILLIATSLAYQKSKLLMLYEIINSSFIDSSGCTNEL